MAEYFDDFPVKQTVRDMILDGFERGGDKPQFVFESHGDEITKTFADTGRDTLDFGAFLRSRGVGKGSKLAILCSNSYFWNVVFYAAAINGSVIIPLDTALSREAVLEQVAGCGCETLFYSENNADKALYAKENTGSQLKNMLTLDKADEYLEEGKAADKKYRDAFLGETVDAEDMLAIVYTSGTTGRTKGIMLSNKNICSNVYALLHIMPGAHGIGFLPLNHTYAWVTGLFATLIKGEWGYICTNLAHIYKDIKKYKPYQFAAVPLVVEMIYQNIILTAKRKGEYDTLMSAVEVSRNFMLSGYDARREMFAEIHENLGGNLETIYCGGAYLSPKIEEFMHDVGIQIITGYGLTECSPTVTCSRRYDYKIGSAGKPIECCEIKINDPDEDGIGEIYVRGDNVMMGYYGDEEATKAAFDGDWLKTGDVGYIDSDGFLFFTGRKKNLIVLSNGKNVSPEEIEAALVAGIDAVKEVVVFDKDGKIAAEVYLDEEKYPDARQTLESDIERVNDTLPEYERILVTVIRDKEFDKTTTLKIKRHIG